MAASRIRRRLLAVLRGAPDGQQLTVMIKLHRHDPAFAALPMSNVPSNARALAFAAHVEALLLRANPGQAQACVIQRGANVCVFVVQAPADVIELLVALPEVQSADVMRPPQAPAHQ